MLSNEGIKGKYCMQFLSSWRKYAVFASFIALMGLFSVGIQAADPEPLVENNFNKAIKGNKVNFVIARVNEDIITYNDIEAQWLERSKRLISGVGNLEKRNELLKEIFDNLLEHIIYKHLVLQEARKPGLKIENLTDDHVKEYMAEVIRNRFGDEEKARKVLAESGETLEDLYEKCKNDLLVSALRRHAIRKQTLVSPKEIRDYFEKNVNRFRVSERRKARGICLFYGKDRDEDQALVIVDEILKELKENKKFEDLAVKYSEVSAGKKGGWLKEGAFFPRKSFANQQLEEKIFKMKTGEIDQINIPPVDDSKGRVPGVIWIVKVEEIREEGVQPFDEDVQAQIRKQLTDAKEDNASREYLIDLAKEAVVRVYRADKTEIKNWLQNRWIKRDKVAEVKKEKKE